jgi:hypothetical protein
MEYSIRVCECGKEYKANIKRVEEGKSLLCKSCNSRAAANKGWQEGKMNITHNITHGESYSKLYMLWRAMLNRCTNKTESNIKYYISKGITVCEEWKSSYEVFRDWSLDNGYEEGLSLDRKDSDKNYYPGNCRWVTAIVQHRNTRKIYSHNTSGYRGVQWRKARNKWVARIKLEKWKHISTHNTALEAAIAYDTYILENNLEHTPNGVL